MGLPPPVQPPANITCQRQAPADGEVKMGIGFSPVPRLGRTGGSRLRLSCPSGKARRLLPTLGGGSGWNREPTDRKRLDDVHTMRQTSNSEFTGYSKAATLSLPRRQHSETSSILSFSRTRLHLHRPPGNIPIHLPFPPNGTIWEINQIITPATSYIDKILRYSQRH